ncbi:galactoside alpha-(1,2)-fucosyltransferase 1 [Caerostris darwini]|uniref:L-Fucosyltransferase n=1 Tax=Caerostris darwini TaxID=1538125 RepID=A0AAV4PWQ3_9ARAC|nr:galactoside alpha-(1,2)-fucosyltransferase 1 [Caerostris darwini]
MCTYASLYGLGALNKDRSIVAPYCNLKHLKSIFEHLSLPQAPLLYIPINTSNLLSYLKLEDRNIPATSNFIDGFRYPCSYTFFDHAQDEIRREFQFSEDLQRHARKVLSKANVNSLKNPTYVAIHVRRGDYQKRWLDIFKGVAVNKEYFQKALEYFRNKYQRLVFVVVSDDRLWCINHLSGILGVYVTEEAPTPMHDLAVMAHCNHTIMTYGTFGFWGAYLAGGDVVYFDKFLEPNTSFTKNNFIFDKMYPPRWKGIVTTNITKLKYS